MKRFKKFCRDEYVEVKLLLRSIPALVVTLFAVSVVLMNILANKTIVSLYNSAGEQWFGLDGGIIVSWLSFMSMDMITKRFGPKAATKISILAMGINLLCCAIFYIASIIPTDSTLGDFSAFNSVLGGNGWILLGSSIAFLISAIVNNFTNWSVGKLFKKDPDGKTAYFTRTYVSTFIGQFIDNLIFSLFVFMIFAPATWALNWGFSWSFLACITCSLTGAIVELLMEVVFSPFSYKICQRWKVEGVGQTYVDYIKKLDAKEIE